MEQETTYIYSPLDLIYNLSIIYAEKRDFPLSETISARFARKWALDS
jgi:hypothetical protein